METYAIACDNPEDIDFFQILHRGDQRIHNKGAQVAYTAGYVCFMCSENDNVPDVVWENTYLNTNQIDYGAVNSLKGWDFKLNGNNNIMSLFWYNIYSKILAASFSVAVSKQRKILTTATLYLSMRN